MFAHNILTLHCICNYIYAHPSIINLSTIHRSIDPSYGWIDGGVDGWIDGGMDEWVGR